MEKGDFIEIEFTGRVKGGEVFDSNIIEDIKKAELNIKPEPFILCLGQGMFLKAIEDFLIGKKEGSYELSLKPEQAFGKREAKLIYKIPSEVFRKQKLNPVPGAIFNFDGRVARVLAVSGGRVMVDFNNPLAGKEVVYNLKIIRKVEDLNEQIKSFIKFLFKKDLEFEIKEKSLVIRADSTIKSFIELFKEKFKEIFGLNLVIEEIVDSKNKPQKPNKKTQ